MAWSTLRTVRRALAILAAAALLPIVPTAPATAATNAPRLLAPGSREVVNQPYFRWEKVPGATTYQLEISTDSRFLKLYKTEQTSINRFIDTTTWPAGSYWWRVKVVAPFDGDYSDRGQFTRRWLVPDADGRGTEVAARPDNVTVEDVSSADKDVQVAPNRFAVSWEPVADASDYEIYWFEVPDKTTFRVSDKNYLASCSTSHTVLTPTFANRTDDADTIPNGSAVDTLMGDGPCELPEAVAEPGTHLYLRVRAVDVTTDGRRIESLWSDEARDDVEPDRTVVEVVDSLTGGPPNAPATLTGPENAAVSVDTPVLAWEPVTGATHYELVIARDRDFTTRILDGFTNNTRWVPPGRIPEDDVDQTYFWFALPCWESVCLSSTTAVNRPGMYRTFRKHSLTLDTRNAVGRPDPWQQLSWQPYATAVRKANREVGRLADSVGGIQYYEVNWRPHGSGSWTTTKTDLPDWLPDSLPFGTRVDWTVRIVDGSGQVRPWSDVRTDRTPMAAPDRPAALSARRTSPTRVRLDWREPDAKYFPVASYAVFYSTNRKRWKPVNNVQRTHAAFRINGKTRYWFMVTALSRGGESAPSRVYVPRR